MELSLWPTLEDVPAGGIQLGVELAEIVVDRCGSEDAHTLSFPLVDLEHLSLYDDAEALHEEDTAEDQQ